MTIHQLIRGKKDKASKDAILALLDSDPSQIDDLMECFFSDDMRTCQYASWPVGFISDKWPTILHPYIEQMIEVALEPKHNAILRNVLRTLEKMDIPKQHEGLVYDFAYRYASDPKQMIAMRAFGMGVCTNLAMKYPELSAEVIPLLQSIHPEASPGTKARARACLKKLQSIL